MRIIFFRSIYYFAVVLLQFKCLNFINTLVFRLRVFTFQLPVFSQYSSYKLELAVQGEFSLVPDFSD